MKRSPNHNTPLRMLTAAVLVGALSTAANALTLSTPVVDNYGTAANTDCIVTNVGTAPIKVANLTIINFGGTTVAPDFSTCPISPATLAPHASCEAVSSTTVSTWCTATASGNFRLMLNSTDSATGDTRAVAPGTK